VIAASYYLSDTLRAINLYKIVGGAFLTLWQQDALFISVNDIDSLTFESGTIMYVESET